MKRIQILVALLVFTCNVFAQHQNNEADSLLKILVQEKGVVGVTGGISKQGKTVWLGAEGFANKEAKIPFKVATKTRTASIAKSITAVAVMQLVEQGLIDLQASVQTYFPEYPKNKLGDITVHQLLSHTSGIDSYKNNKERQNKKTYESLEEAAKVFNDRKLLFKPGTAFHYTTYGYVVLGVIIENVSGLTYGEYVQQHIFDKSEMNNTGVELFGTTLENKSLFYHRSSKGKVKKSSENNLSNRIPAGGFYTTIEDMLKFGNTIINNTLIKSETLDLMVQHHSLEKYQNGYGYGWFLYGPKENESVLIGHSGEQTGVSAQLFIIPERKTVYAILANTSGAWNDVIKETANLIPIAKKL